MRAFPYQFAVRRKARFFPDEPKVIEGDVLEIGPGRGDLLLTSAEAHRDERFVAIEIKARRFRKLVERVTRRELQNVLLVHGDARIIVEQMVPPSTFERIYVLFPDPWPKRRHEPMRLLSRRFLQLLAERLTPTGELFLATDDPIHRDWVMRNASQVDLLKPTDLHTTGRTPSPDWSPTLYEQKWRDEGRSITYFSYRRVEGSCG